MAKLTRTQLNKTIDDALVLANKASRDKILASGGRSFPCGFAWVIVKPGNSLLAKILVERGLADKHPAGGVCVWNPGKTRYQNVDIPLAGANAFVNHIKKVTGIDSSKIYADSRWD